MLQRKERIRILKKIASKVGFKAGKSINYAEEQNMREPFFSPEELEEIKNIKLDERFLKITNKEEKKFLELGAYLNNSLENLNQIYDFLKAEKTIVKGGDLSKLYPFDLKDVDSIEKVFNSIDQEQILWHQKNAELQKKELNENKEKGKFPNGYISNEVVYSFDDGWNIVYVPAAGEIDAWENLENTSHDRINEGNILGLCLGSNAKRYQTNKHGKVYSVRDAGNNPKATIRIKDDALSEAKAKNNLIPDIETSKHIEEWFSSLESLDYKEHDDYRNLPPLNVNIAEERFLANPKEPYDKEWISSWYRKGSNILDRDVNQKIEEKDPILLEAGLHRKYPDLMEPIIKYWVENGIQKEPSEYELLEYGANRYGKNEAWKTYRNRPWMIEYVKEFASKKPVKFFSGQIRKFYKEIGLQNIEKYIEDNLYSFMRYDVGKDYPEFELTAAKKLSEDKPMEYVDLHSNHNFFKENEKRYGFLGEALENFVKNDPYEFISYYPKYHTTELLELAAKKMRESGKIIHISAIKKLPYPHSKEMYPIILESLRDFIYKNNLSIIADLLISKNLYFLKFVKKDKECLMSLAHKYIPFSEFKNGFKTAEMSRLSENLFYTEYFVSYLSEAIKPNYDEYITYIKDLYGIIGGTEYLNDKLKEAKEKFEREKKHDETFKEFEWQSTGIDPDQFSKEDLQKTYQHSEPGTHIHSPQVSEQTPESKNPFDAYLPSGLWDYDYYYNKEPAGKTEDFEKIYWGDEESQKRKPPEVYQRRIALLMEYLVNNGFYKEAKELEKLK